MKAKKVKKRNAVVIDPETDILEANVDDMREFFAEQLEQHTDMPNIELSAKKIENVDTSGINLLLGFYREAENAGKQFAVTDAGGKLEKIIELGKLPLTGNEATEKIQ